MKNLKYPALRLIAGNVLMLVLIYSTTECNAQSTPRRSLLALSKKEHVLAIVDPVTLKVIARIPVGDDPHEVIASSDGKTAYVTIYGGGSLHELNVIDLVAQKRLKNIDTRPLFGPHDITFVMERHGLPRRVPNLLVVMTLQPGSLTGVWEQARTGRT
ncbi:MAG: hypothetical protein WDO19_30475 [Bacteroidota bacterium]